MRIRRLAATLREWTSRLVATLRPRRADRELEQELRAHLELAAEDAARRGQSPAEARRATVLDAGGIAQAMEALREQRSFAWLDDALRDLRYGGRMLARDPGFTAVSVISLAIGIGANCAAFSFADTLLLRPLTVPRAAELLTVGQINPFEGSLDSSYRDFIDIRDRDRSFEGLTAYAKSTAGFATGAGVPAKLSIGLLVGGNFFRVIGVEPQLGRDFRPEEDEVPGRNAVVILGHEFWAREFGADRSILGRTVRLNGAEFTVVGVAPAGFTGVDQFVRFQFYAPLMMWPRFTADAGVRIFEARDYRRLTIAGRLRPGVTMAQAQAELTTIAADLEREHPDTNRNARILVRTELQNRVAQAPPVATLVAMLMALAALVLFVACANVAGLLASRAPMRAREMAMRLAIGAGRPRIVRQLIVESMLVAALGCALGLGIGYAAVMLFSRIQIPVDLPITAAFTLDRRALLFSVAVAIASACLFGLAPAVRSARTDLTAVMKASDAAGYGRRRHWGRRLLVAGQVAVAVVLLVVATFAYRGFQKQLGSGPGFRTDRLLMMSVAPKQLRYSDEQAQQFFEKLAASARLLPGVKSATVTRYMPMDGVPPATAIVPEGFQFPPGQESVVLASSIVDERYFDTIGLPILEGRAFQATDTADAPRVAIVNEVAAQRYWPGRSAIGKRFRLDNARGPWALVVGIAKTSKYTFVMENPKPFVYLPFRQRPADSMFLLAESIGEPSSLAAPLRELVGQLDANLPIANIRTMEELYRMRSVIVLDVIVTTIGAMGGMGLVLAVVGLYGLVAYAASRRTKEIGIRLAIGAGRSSVLRMVLSQALRLTLGGLVAGLAASFGAGPLLDAIFARGMAGDGTTAVAAFGLVASTVLFVSLIAAYIPARRASMINPTEALRSE
jgi:predicted permease